MERKKLIVAGPVRFWHPYCLEISIFKISEKDMIRKRDLHPQVAPSDYKNTIFPPLKFQTKDVVPNFSANRTIVT